MQPALYLPGSEFSETGNGKRETPISWLLVTGYWLLVTGYFFFRSIAQAIPAPMTLATVAPLMSGTGRVSRLARLT